MKYVGNLAVKGSGNKWNVNLGERITEARFGDVVDNGITYRGEYIVNKMESNYSGHIMLDKAFDPQTLTAEELNVIEELGLKVPERIADVYFFNADENIAIGEFKEIVGESVEKAIECLKSREKFIKNYLHDYLYYKKRLADSAERAKNGFGNAHQSFTDDLDEMWGWNL